MTDENELLKLYEEYKEKVITFNLSIWSTLLTLHGIIIAIFSILIALASTKNYWVTFVLFPLALILSLFSIWFLLHNLSVYRTIYKILAENFHPKNKDNAEENLEIEKEKIPRKRAAIIRKESFARFAAVFNIIIIFVCLIIISYEH